MDPDLVDLTTYFRFNFPGEVRRKIDADPELTVTRLATEMGILPNALWNRLAHIARFTLPEGIYLMKRFNIGPHREEDTCSTT